MLRRSRWWWTCAPSLPSADGPVRVTMRGAGELEIGRVDVELLQNPFDPSRVEILLNRRDPCSDSNAVMRALALLLVERPRKIALSCIPAKRLDQLVPAHLAAMSSKSSFAHSCSAVNTKMYDNLPKTVQPVDPSRVPPHPSPPKSPRTPRRAPQARSPSAARPRAARRRPPPRGGLPSWCWRRGSGSRA